jgi:NAD(P)-dependent dehydrogenase (short-subunit alcohol dehydrogenase family)
VGLEEARKQVNAARNKQVPLYVDGQPKMGKKLMASLPLLPPFSYAHFSGTAWDTANAAVFLASSEAGFITGTLLPVDGGQCVFTG